MGDELAGPLPALITQSNSELNAQTINTNQNLNHKNIQSPLIPSTQNKPINNFNNQLKNTHNYSHNNINTNSTNSKSFAETTASINYPKMNQAIVLTAIEGLKQIDYLSAISKYTAPINIISASRISNNRFCIFLNTQNNADDLIKKHSSIFIGENEIFLRKLVNPSKKIILSNVYPIITNETIINAFQEIGIRITSAIHSLKSIHSSDLFSHVTSFRRQLYINPEDLHKLPDSIVLKHEDTNFRIYITDDSLACFICKQNGHTPSTCKYSTESTSQITHTDQIDAPSHSTSLQPNSEVQTEQDTNIHINTEHIINHNTDTNSNTNTNLKTDSNKRPISVSTEPSSPASPSTKIPPDPTSSTSATNSQSTQNNTLSIPKKNKKARASARSPSRSLDRLDEQLNPSYEYFLKNPGSCNYNSFKYVIENFSNKNIKILDLCNQAGTNIPELHKITETIHPMLTDRSIKTKIKKLTNLLFQMLPDEN